MTICPDYTVAYKTDELAKYNVTASDIRKFKFPKLENMTSLEFFREVTFDLDEVLMDMVIEAAYIIEGTRVSSFYITENWPEGEHPTERFYGHFMYLNFSEGWKTEYYKTFGRCYTYTIPDWIKKQRV